MVYNYLSKKYWYGLSLLNIAYLRRTHSGRSVCCSTRMVGRYEGSVESKGMGNIRKRIDITLVMDLISRTSNIQSFQMLMSISFFVYMYMYIKFCDITYENAVSIALACKKKLIN